MFECGGEGKKIENLALSCKVHWSLESIFYNRFQVTPNSKLVIQSDGSLLIRMATVDDSGMYACRIANIGSTPEIERFRLQVEGKKSSTQAFILESVNLCLFNSQSFNNVGLKWVLCVFQISAPCIFFLSYAQTFCSLKFKPYNKNKVCNTSCTLTDTCNILWNGICRFGNNITYFCLLWNIYLAWTFSYVVFTTSWELLTSFWPYLIKICLLWILPVCTLSHFLTSLSSL